MIHSFSGFLLLVSLGGIFISNDGRAEAPIVHPGAPGESARVLSAKEAVEIAGTAYSPDDAQFMQDMIPHHHQAIEMAELVADRTNRQELSGCGRTHRCLPGR